MGSSKALASLKCANLSASPGVRRMAGNDIAIGLVLGASCPPISNAVSDVVEAIECAKEIEDIRRVQDEERSVV